ncbi:MAG: lipid-A-disaccharide synthase N-terminal domain-containing protein [Alphaproteobacteria bacterium]|nr:lipid-A-disaccharide synthase N-terminal domain-containing protein [Alphaproteobacteria bacterium]MDX5370302.1 lipid-A-disaccharide synthase N-terminal domain-containing protein [Alphaproteobacteria bacterium]MDX5464838.1 lipid-A-disaccharide synthase N-terminal domain-containing protein [Alphaproteobacteria bacterium]
MTGEQLWLGIGFVGQALFSGRFLVQWIASEMRRESIVPLAFWWFSIAGGTTLFAYALWREDPVFIAGQGLGLVIYARNLVLIGRRRREDARGEAAA